MKKTILLLFFFGGLAIAAASAQNVNHLTLNAGGGFGGAFGNVGKVTGKSYDGVAGVGWDEFAEIRLASGERIDTRTFVLAAGPLLPEWTERLGLDVTIVNEVVGAAKLARLAALAREVRVGVAVDDVENVRNAVAVQVAALGHHAQRP